MFCKMILELLKSGGTDAGRTDAGRADAEKADAERADNDKRQPLHSESCTHRRRLRFEVSTRAVAGAPRGVSENRSGGARNVADFECHESSRHEADNRQSTESGVFSSESSTRNLSSWQTQHVSWQTKHSEVNHDLEDPP